MAGGVEEGRVPPLQPVHHSPVAELGLGDLGLAREQVAQLRIADPGAGLFNGGLEALDVLAAQQRALAHRHILLKHGRPLRAGGLDTGRKRNATRRQTLPC